MSSQTQRYKIKDPYGKEHVIEGPAGASDEEIIEQSKLLFAPKGIGDARNNNTRDLDTVGMIDNQIVNVLEGAGIDPSSPVLGTLKNMWTGLRGSYDRGMGYAKDAGIKGAGPAIGTANAVKDIGVSFVTAPFRAAANLIQGTVEGDAEQAARGAGGFATSVPAIAGAARIPGAIKNIVSPPLTPANVINSLTTLSRSGIKSSGTMPQAIAETVQPHLSYTAQRLGVSPEAIPIVEGAKNAPIGTLLKGADDATHARVAKALGYKAGDVRSVPIMLTEEMVKDIHAPSKAILNNYANENLATVSKQVANDLRREAANTPPTSLRNELEFLADEVSKAQLTHELGTLKEMANKKSAALFDKSTPGAEATATAQSAFAWKLLGDKIREYMYPELESRGAVGLAEQGRLEAKAWDVRDGVFREWATAAGDQAPAALQSWLSRFGKDLVQAAYFPKGAAMSAGKKWLSGEQPMQTFNRLFRDSITDIGLTRSSGPYLGNTGLPTKWTAPKSTHPGSPSRGPANTVDEFGNSSKVGISDDSVKTVDAEFVDQKQLPPGPNQKRLPAAGEGSVTHDTSRGGTYTVDEFGKASRVGESPNSIRSVDAEFVDPKGLPAPPKRTQLGTGDPAQRDFVLGEKSTPGQVIEKTPDKYGKYWMEGEEIPRLPKDAIILGKQPADISRLQVISEKNSLAYDPVTGQTFTFALKLKNKPNVAATPLRDASGRIKSTLPKPPQRTSNKPKD